MPKTRKINYNILEIECRSEVELDQVFCNCSIMMGVHDKDCPNYGKSFNPPVWYIDLTTDVDGELRKYRYHIDRMEEVNIKDKDE